jgi:ketosteroid isomerase-like protein
MSQENVELVRRVFDAINRGDVDRALEAAADDIEMDWSSSVGPEQGSIEGRSRSESFGRPLPRRLMSCDGTRKKSSTCDDFRVIAVNHVRMRGRESGVEVDAVGAQLWTISEGKSRRLKLYQAKAEALEAVGLRE